MERYSLGQVHCLITSGWPVIEERPGFGSHKLTCRYPRTKLMDYYIKVGTCRHPHWKLPTETRQWYRPNCNA